MLRAFETFRCLSLVGFLTFTWACLSSGTIFAEESNATEPFPIDAEKREADAFEKLATKVKPSIALIESVDRIGQDGGRGTGFVVRKDGVIATNFHVIGEHRDFRVRFANGKSYEPQAILAVDRERDLALVKIDAEDLPVLALGDSDELKLGQGILSLGNPLGYAYSVSRGVVAALRELEPGDGKPMVQVAIPIEPGSSGSPALDLKGKVIAVLAIKSGGAMGFGVPVNALKQLLANPNPVSIKHWLTIGALDEDEWESILGGNWRQRAGKIMASGMGSGFGGRMLCLSKEKVPAVPYEMEIEVKLEDDSGAAGLVFHGDGGEIHYGFYPTNGSLRLTRFEGPTVFNWTILQTIPSQAYKPGEWNRIRVSIGAEGKLACSVNGSIVIDLVDKGLTKGRVGLCKFRQPGAEFRRFRIAKSLPEEEIPEGLAKRVKRIVHNLENDEKLGSNDLNSLVSIGKPASKVLLEKADALEKAASRVRMLAEEVRERAVIEELASSLKYEDEKSVDLFRCALLIARLDNEDFDPEIYLRRIERIALKVKKSFPEEASGDLKLKILVSHLFDELGFHGSTLDYYHKSNSYLNEVMDDREGLPITLAVVLIEIAERLDLPVTGLGIPGHFLAMYREDKGGKEPKKQTEEILIDAFSGKFVTREEASELSGVRLTEDDFEPASKRSIITRILRNLISVSERERDSASRLRYLDATIAIEPKDTYLRAMRAMVHYGEGRFQQALTDIDFLIENNPDGPEMEPLREIRDRLRSQAKE